MTHNLSSLIDRFVSDLRAHRFDGLDAALNAQQKQYESGTLAESSLLAQWPHLHLQRVDLIPHAWAWTQACPDSYAAHVFMASLQKMVGWQARGTAPSSQTSVRQFDVMQQHFQVALQHVHRALALSDCPATALASGIQITQAGSDDPDFDYVQRAEPVLARSPMLCGVVMWSLNPKWGGSLEQLQSFLDHALTRPNVTPGDRGQIEAHYWNERADISLMHGDTDKAMNHLKTSLSRDPAQSDAHSLKSRLYADRDDYRQAVASIRTALERETTPARLEKLGIYLENSEQADQAAHAYERALFWGSGYAAGRLLNLHREKTADPRVSARIDEWAEHGLSQYSPEAMFAAGAIDYADRGTDQDKQRSYGHWWLHAADWGQTSAQFNLANAYWHGVDGQPVNPQRAFSYAKAAADAGDDNGHDMIGRMYFHGDCTTRDHAAAAPHLEQAAHAGLAKGMRDWIRCLWFGLGTPKDRVAAKQWLEQLKALDPQCHQEAMSHISSPTNIIKSWFQRS
jgi:TPR repeat protein